MPCLEARIRLAPSSATRARSLVVRTLRHAHAHGARAGGSKVACPDCGKAKVVQLPWVHGKQDAPTTTESYEVYEEIGQPPPESVAYQEHVGFACRCGTDCTPGRRGGPAADLPRMRPVGHRAVAPRSGPSPTPRSRSTASMRPWRQRTSRGRTSGSSGGSAPCWTNMVVCRPIGRLRAGRCSREFSPFPGVTAPGRYGSRSRSGRC